MSIKAKLLLLVNLFTFNSYAGTSIKIHAIHKETFACTEHWDGQFKYVGDALGTDCVIGAWDEEGKPIQIQFDQSTLALIDRE